MKTFLIKIGIASLLAGILHLAFSLFSDGKTDDFYLRFTTPKASSLIIGSSRAAQGIQPDSLQTWCAASGFSAPIYNFAFTSPTSPYGETYYKAIMEKLDASATHGFYIVAVEPYTLGEVENPKDKNPKEFKGQLYNAHWFNQYPNLEYLLRHYNYGWGRLALTSFGVVKNNNTLHENGWLEVNVKVDSVAAEKRAAGNIADRRQDFGKFALTPYRVEWFNKTIDALKKHGTVLIVRMPVSAAFYAFENELAPDFNRLVNDVAQQQGVIYHDFNTMSHLLSYKDGHHMQLSSTPIFSGYLRQWLATEFITSQQVSQQ
jgi:hypothetical protein